MKNVRILLFVVLFAMIGCKDNSTNPPSDNSQNDGKELVKVHLDLQEGFAGKIVIIELNGERNYYSILSDIVSLAGPEADFCTYLPRGQNKLGVYLRDPANYQNFVADSTVIDIGSGDQYFLGLRMNNDFEVTVQDSSFFYI